MGSLLECLLAAALFLQVTQVVLLFFILRSSLRPYVDQELLKNVRDLKSSLWRLEGRAWDRDSAALASAPPGSGPTLPHRGAAAAPLAPLLAPLVADAQAPDGDAARFAHPDH